MAEPYAFEEERRILRKYSEGRIVDPEDASIVHDLVAVSFMHLGLSLSKKVETARTTSAARDLFCSDYINVNGQ